MGTGQGFFFFNISKPTCSFSYILKSSLSACIHIHCAFTDTFQTTANLSSLLLLQNITTSASVAYMVENAMVTILVVKILVFQQKRHEIQITELTKLNKSSGIRDLNWRWHWAHDMFNYKQIAQLLSLIKLWIKWKFC